MATSVEFGFDMGAMVQVRTLNIEGRVIGLMVDRDAIQQALVERLLSGGQIEREWFRMGELKGADDVIADIIQPPDAVRGDDAE